MVPILHRLLQPSSIVDVGCGVGIWLQEFLRAGVPHVLGVDGEHVTAAGLRIPESCFAAHDLASPLRLDRTFDMALSLEVGEHLPPASAGAFVESLCLLAPVVAFSAAIPFQGGGGHVNEQWPDYWAALFARYGRVPVDILRPLVWNDGDIAWWYRQNLLLYADEQRAALLLEAARGFRMAPAPLPLVHPALYSYWTDPSWRFARDGWRSLRRRLRLR